MFDPQRSLTQTGPSRIETCNNGKDVATIVTNGTPYPGIALVEAKVAPQEAIHNRKALLHCMKSSTYPAEVVVESDTSMAVTHEAGDPLSSYC